MTTRGPVALLLGALLAACQPPPHPFADDRPPASLMTVRDSAGISVGPVEGEPKRTAAKLPGAIAKALLQREIPATDKSTGTASNLLSGRIEKLPAPPG